MTRRRRAAGVVTAAVIGLAVAAPAASASTAGSPPKASPPGITLTGCRGNGTSQSSNGTALQSALAPNPPASKNHPLLVDPGGNVRYRGSSAGVITNHSWRIKVDGITVKSGGSPNASRKSVNQGTVKVKDYLPFKITGLFYVSGAITGNGGSCTGSFWVKVTGSPVGTVPWIVGMVLALGGAAGLFFSRPSFPSFQVNS